MAIVIKMYDAKDFEQLISIIELEGDEWDYWKPEYREMYKSALEKSITYVAWVDYEICGFSRSVDDFATEIIVCDLLVTPEHRSKDIGKELLERIANDFPEKNVYVMSDVDEYYLKQGYVRVGSVIRITKAWI